MSNNLYDVLLRCTIHQTVEWIYIPTAESTLIEIDGLQESEKSGTSHSACAFL